MEKASASLLGFSNDGTEWVFGAETVEEKLGPREDVEIGGGLRAVAGAPDERGVTIGVTTPVSKKKDLVFFVLNQVHQWLVIESLCVSE